MSPSAPIRDLSRLVVTGFEGTRLDARTRRRLSRLEPGGVVLFRRNVGEPPELESLTRSLRDLLGPAALIAVDQEGGRVARLRAPFTVWPPMREIGATRSPALARAVGRALGSELAAAGFNGDFAPVLDVDTRATNPIIGDRSFSADPAVVARLGLALAAGLGEAGILACGKHFPGHGDTTTDSHLALPVVGRTYAELSRVELRPFRVAIRQGLPLLMSAHVLYPELDPALPATLSAPILRGLLRERLGFAGVAVSDDLAMHALDTYGSVGELAVGALAAGCDWLLACQSLDAGEQAVGALAAAVRSGSLPHDTVRAALRRVDRVRARLTRRRVPVDALAVALAEGSAVLDRLAARGERAARSG